MKNFKGFTLIELMLAIGLVAILAALAVPAFQDMIANNRMVGAINKFQGSLLYAKNDAITTNRGISLCTRNTAGTNCDNASNWEDGWIIFRDINVNGALDSPDCTDSTKDCILKIYEPLHSTLTLRSNGTIGNTLSFDARAFAQNTGVFTLCDSRGATKAEGIKVAFTGGFKRLTDTNNDGINDDSGTNLSCP